LEEYPAEQIDWLWPGYIPAGKLTVIEGDPDRGKSLMTLDLAARLTSGRPWPNSTAAPAAAAVVLVGSEDSLRDTVVPRLLAAGADLSRIRLFAGRRRPDGRYRLPAFPDDADALAEVIAENNARLAIIDPFTAFLSTRTCSLNDQMIRQVLTPLAQVADVRR